MAVYWVDPYIEADIGSIHGTTDTTSRSGTYAAPYAITDIIGTSTTDTGSKISGLSDGDEVRLKGLAMSSFLIDAGTFYTPDYRYTRKTGETAPTAWSDARTARSSGAARNWAGIYNKTHTDAFSAADSDGNKPYWVFQMWDNGTNDELDFHSSQRTAPYILHDNISPYNDAANTTLNMQVIDWQYYIIGTQIPTGDIYFGCSQNIGVKITDGWTSETVRDGVTCLIWSPTNATSGRTVYLNESGNGSSLCDTLYDLKNTIWCWLNDTSYSYSYHRWYWYSAKGGYYNGDTYTQRFGSMGMAGLYDSNLNTRSQYYNAVASNAAGAVNNFEIGFWGERYGINDFTNLDYGDGSAATRINNAITGQRGGIQGFSLWSSGTQNLTLGTVFVETADANGAIIYKQPNIGGWGPTDNTDLLNNSFYVCYEGYSSFAPSVYTFSFPTVIYSPSNSSDVYASSTGGPAYFSSIGGSGVNLDITMMYQQEVELASSNWWETPKVHYASGLSSTDQRFSQLNIALGKLVCGGSDYRSTSPTFLVETDTYLYSDNTTYSSDINLHFSTNDFDDIPVGAAFARTNLNAHTPMLYFNDSDKSEALCFIKPDVTGNYDYKKNIEIPCDPYSSGNTVTVTFNVETTSTFSDYVYLYVFYVNSGGTVTSASNTFNTAITTATDRTVTLSSVGTNNANHMMVQIRVDTNTGQGPSGNAEKLWVHSITAAVT